MPSTRLRMRPGASDGRRPQELVPEQARFLRRELWCPVLAPRCTPAERSVCASDMIVALTALSDGDVKQVQDLASCQRRPCGGFRLLAAFETRRFYLRGARYS